MQRSLTYRFLFGVTAIIWLLAASCLKRFEDPADYTPPAITANMTIRELRNLHSTGNFTQVTADRIISGVVVANDATGNFYKSITIQDATAAIQVNIDGFDLNALFPLGRRVYIKVKNLWLGDFRRYVQLGGSVDRTVPTSPELAPIPMALLDQYIIRAESGQRVNPTVLNINQLSDQYQGMLIRINQVEFIPVDANKLYADAVNKVAVSRTFGDCFGNAMVMRTSGYASFASSRTPAGHGSITGIYTVFNNTGQIVIRDTTDIEMPNTRCSSGSPVVLLNEDFETTISGGDINLFGWRNIAESGGKKFAAKSFSFNNYAEISAFNSAQSNMTTWLISPAFDLNNTANEILSFRTKDGFNNGAVFQVLISTNYNGGNTPWTATWTNLGGTIALGSTSGFAPNWTNSGNISLATYSGNNVYIAFRYAGADPASGPKRTTTFQLDDIRIQGN